MKIKLLDKLMKTGYFKDEKTARAWIMNKNVFINGVVMTKSGMLVDANAEINVKKLPLKFASKGGYKLEKALRKFKINVQGKTIFDAGASAGGFTDCLLQQGAIKVYSVDVGYGQLSGYLRNDKRVCFYEKCNISDFKKADLDEQIDLCTADLSYLSIQKSIPVLSRLFDSTPKMVFLIKPLYEGLPQENKSDFKEAAAILSQIIKKPSLQNYRFKNLALSPIFGGRGAIEFLAYIEKVNEAIRSEQDTRDLLDSLESEYKQSPPLPFEEYLRTI